MGVHIVEINRINTYAMYSLASRAFYREIIHCKDLIVSGTQ